MRRTALAVLMLGSVLTAGCGNDGLEEPLRSPLDSAAAAEATPTPEAVTVNGRTFLCDYSVVDEIDDAGLRADVRKRRARELRQTLRRLDRKYPGTTAPAPVVERYNALVRDYNLFVKQANGAVRKYNGLLREKCDKE